MPRPTLIHPALPGHLPAADMVAAIFDRLPGKRLSGEVFSHNGELMVNSVNAGFHWDYEYQSWLQPTAWYKVRKQGEDHVSVLRIEVETESSQSENATLRFLEKQIVALVEGRTWVDIEGEGAVVKIAGWRILRKPGHSHPEFVWLSLSGDEYEPRELADKGSWDAAQLWDQCEAEYEAARSERAHAQRVADDMAFDTLKR